MLKKADIDIRPSLFYCRDDDPPCEVELAVDSPFPLMFEHPAEQLDGWHLRRDEGRKYGVIPISELVPFRLPSTTDVDRCRTSDHVRITKVKVSFTACLDAPVRFICFAYRHGQRVGDPLVVPSRPHVDTVKYSGLSRPRQPVYALLFDLLTEEQVKNECGGVILDVLHDRPVREADAAVGRVFASLHSSKVVSCGNKFDNIIMRKKTTRSRNNEIWIDMCEDIHYLSSMTSASVDGRPLELLVGIESEGSGSLNDALIDLPILVSVEFCSI